MQAIPSYRKSVRWTGYERLIFISGAKVFKKAHLFYSFLHEKCSNQEITAIFTRSFNSYMENKDFTPNKLSFNVKDGISNGSSVLDDDVKELFKLEQYPQTVDVSILCVCLKGECSITIDAKSYHVKKGDMCVILPHSIFHINRQSPDFFGYVSACTTDFLNSINVSSGTGIYLYIKDNPCLSLEENEVDELVRMCNFLKEYDTRKGCPYRKEITGCLSLAVIYEVIGIYKKRQPPKPYPYSRKNKLYHEYMELVAKKHKEQRCMEFYADKLCISSRYLSSICKEIVGKTAKECLDEYIAINIRAVLTTTDMTIQQISEAFNFPNASFFTKFFKAQTGVTPKEYRNIIGD